MNGEFERSCSTAALLASKCVESFLDNVTSISNGDRSLVQISFTQVAEHGDVVFSFERIWYASLSNLDNLESSFVDGIFVSHLSSDDQEWPEVPARVVRRFDGMPSLIYFHVKGPVELVVIAAIVTVLSAYRQG